MTIPVAPVLNKTDESKGIGVTRPWKEYYNSLNMYLGDLNSSIDTSKEKVNSITYSSNPVNLTSTIWGKMIKIENGGLNFTVNLPLIGSSDVDSITYIMKMGTGMLTITANGSNVFEAESGRTENSIICQENRRLANVILYVASSTQWAILGGTGIWKVF